MLVSTIMLVPIIGGVLINDHGGLDEKVVKTVADDSRGEHPTGVSGGESCWVKII